MIVATPNSRRRKINQQRLGREFLYGRSVTGLKGLRIDVILLGEQNASTAITSWTHAMNLEYENLILMEWFQ